jgi:hypothetical protein
MAAWLVIMVITWAIPLLLLVWLIRSVNAMVAAQKQIAEQLAIIARAMPAQRADAPR